MDSIKINWEKFRSLFELTGYLTFDEEIEQKRLKILLDKDQKETLKIKQFNTWKYPLERQNPDIIKMILNLNERLSAIEKKIGAIENSIMNLNGILICNKEEEPEPQDGNGTLEDLEVYYNNNHKENQEEFKLSDEVKK